MDQLINPTPLHPLLNDLQVFREGRCYRRKPPLGISAGNHPPLPPKVFHPDFRFGMAVQNDEYTAKDLIHPNLFGVHDKTAEQINRKYTNFVKTQIFGLNSTPDPSERQFLLWGNPITYRSFLSLHERRKLERQSFHPPIKSIGEQEELITRKMKEKEERAFFLKWEGDDTCELENPKRLKTLENQPASGVASIRTDKIPPESFKKRLTDVINYGDEPTVKDLIQVRFKAMYTEEEIQRAKEKLGMKTME
ncbi:hypothetical protein HMI54_011192 [Coelomomyces lativittatus]|nr:hypothetical protein HMI55_000679 [Coelomomyces lativittatus]KAJ1513774.1 hypothetical protein HMI56_001792 [Coelomomyces lativittatus]KAJ1516010.1 hypothetical protein HMI54_011192 [Coelomomyces lativittatus]